MPVSLPIGDPALVPLIERELAAQPEERILRLHHENLDLVVKRASDQTRSPLVTWIAARIARHLSDQAPPRASLTLADQRSLIRIESRRLRALHAAGVRVPRVIAEDAGWLALEAVGDTLEHARQRLSGADWDLQALAAMDDLANFHRAGHWHGASQAKNLMLWQDRIYRIDFEEDIGDHLPLAVAQTLDLVLLVNSCLLLDDRGEGAWDAMGETLFRRYFAARPAPEIRDCLKRAMGWLRAIAWLARPWRNRRGRSLRRVFLLRDILERVLARP